MKRSALPLAFGGQGLLGADVLEPKALARFAKGKGFVARAVVGHHALDVDTQAPIVSDRSLQEGDGAGLPLVLHDLAEGNPGSIVDTDMDVLLRLTMTGFAIGKSVSATDYADTYDRIDTTV